MGRTRLRLLFLTQTYPRYDEDTAGPFIRDLARALVFAGDGVTVLTPHAEGLRDAWQDDGVEVRTFRYAPASHEVLGYGRSLRADEQVRLGAALVAPLYLLAARRAIAQHLEHQPCDLVHAHWVVPNGLAASWVPRLRRGIPALAIGLHGSDVFLAERAGVRPLVRAALRRSRLLTGCSPELVERVRRLGFEGDLWRVIPYGVNSRTFAPCNERRQLWRDRLGVPAGAPLVLGVGRMATKKGFHVLVEALGPLLDRIPETHVVLAGGGDRLEELRERCQRFAGRVHFPGPVERDTLPDLYRAADLFVLPAVHDPRGNVDGLPNVILEAMASALPVVATRISGIPQAVSDGVEGVLVEENDAAGLAKALQLLIENPDLRRERGRQARAKVERELTWRAVAERYRQGYLEALEGVSGG